MAYKYITQNNLYEKQNYMYSEYRGGEFLKEYVDSRERILNCRKDSERMTFDRIEGVSNPIQQDLCKIYGELEAGKYNKEIKDAVDAYTKSFEVRKRIYMGYNDNWKPLDGIGFEDYESYLLLAECLLLVYQRTKCLKYFNCLLKVDDTLLSIQDKLAVQSIERFYRIVRQELEIFYQLADENEINWEAAK